MLKVDGQRGGCLDERINGLIGGSWMDVIVNGYMDGWVDGGRNQA